MEDYKKKYEEALDNFKKIKAANKYNNELVDFIEYKYPELKENKDEMIRNFLISKMKEVGNVWKEYSSKDIIAWLEKQGEQKSTWGEEDERMLGKAISTIMYALSIPFGKEDDPCFAGSSTIAWLKSLKERMKGE